MEQSQKCNRWLPQVTTSEVCTGKIEFDADFSSIELAAWTVAAASAAITAITAGRTARLFHGVGLAFGARDLDAGGLIDDLHRKTGLTAIIEAQQLDVDFLTFLDDLAFLDGDHFRLHCDGLDAVHGGVDLLFFGAGDFDRAVVFNVDLGAALLDDGTDHRAA